MSAFWGNQVITRLSGGLDAAALRQRVHADNLANVNTPGFKRSFVQFKGVLENAASGKDLAVTADGHIRRSSGDFPGARVVTDTGTAMRPDGNNVDVDREMAELAMNQLYYHALSQQLGDRLGMLRYVINEGRR